MTVAFSTVCSPEELAALAGEWDGLVRAAERSSPFQLTGWLAPWWRRFAPEAKPAVEVARRDGRLVAALPLLVQRRRGVRVAKFVGGPLAEISDALLAPGEDPAIIRSLLDRIDADVLHLQGVGVGSVLTQASPNPPELVMRAEAPVVLLGRAWDDLYKEKLSAATRKVHRKRTRQLNEAGSVELREVADTDELAAVLEEAFLVHRARWAGQPDRSGFTTPDGAAFHRDAISALPAGVPRISTLRLDGVLIAYYYRLLLDGRSCGADMAYLPSYSRFSPGWIATLHMLEQAATEHGAREVEFLGGREDYKLAFADEQRPLHEAFLRPRTLAARVYVGSRLASVRLRRRLKEMELVHRVYYDGFAPARRAAARLRRVSTTET